MQTLPLTRDLVLVGGGHAHALVLKRWAMRPLPGARVTVVNPGPTAPYTGMLPGFVAGHYDRETLEIDLVRLARAAGARIVLGEARAIDRETRRIEIDDMLIGSRAIGYDVLSLDVGIRADTSIAGFETHAVAAKPLARFADRWEDFVAGRGDTARMVVIGGGPGGVELAMAMAHRLRGRGGPAPRITLVENRSALSQVTAGARRKLLAAMTEAGVAVIEHARVAEIRADAVRLEDGREIASDFTCGATGAKPFAWLGGIGVPLHEGYVRVGPTLQSVGDPRIFAAGDCAHLDHAPRPKAGVYAVRAAKVLDANLRAALGDGRMRRFRPQRRYLKLISTGGRGAVSDRGGAWPALSGPWLWRWKDRIDRAFMERLSDLAPMPAPPLPRRRAAGMERLTRQAPCGGCGAKVGRETLVTALSSLAGNVSGRPDVLRGPGDDAAVLSVGGAHQVLTVDQLRAFSDDPGVMAHVAAHHALGDCLAMGAAPQAALPILTLPRADPAIEGRMLSEITAAAARVFAAAGAEIVGGHSATGAEAAYGFAVTGLGTGREIGLDGAGAGDVLILTQPLGTGVVLAGDMALMARGAWVVETLRAMCRGKGRDAAALSCAHAMTDVTGFGLAGHLMGMLEASRLSARIDAAALPLLPGALDLLERGIRSTLHEANAALGDRVHLPDGPHREILFDPQTAGGLLAAVAPDMADGVMAALAHEGAQAARIGTLEDGPPEIRSRV